MPNLRQIRRALEVSGAVYEAVRAALRTGISEREIYELAGRTAGSLLAGQDWEYLGDFVSGVRTAEIGGEPTDRRLCDGELFILDLSVRCGEGWCDTCRTFFLGQPSAEVRRAYEAVLRCQQIGAMTVRSGVKASEVKRVMEAYLAGQGYGGHMPHHGGHRVGNAPYEKPAFEEGCDMTVQVGDVVTLEPGLYFSGRFGLRVENDYLVTENGLTNLFDYPVALEHFIITEKESAQ